MDIYIKWIDRMNKAVGVFLAVLLAIMSAIIIFQVFSRFILHYPLPWSEELARYLSAYVVVLGAAIALRYNKLIAVDILSEMLSEKNKKILGFIVLLITIAFSAIILVKGIDVVQQVNTQRSPSMQISMSYPYASIPIGAMMMILNSVALIVEMVRGRDA